jgi:hypothetical protein
VNFRCFFSLINFAKCLLCLSVCCCNANLWYSDFLYAVMCVLVRGLSLCVSGCSKKLGLILFGC